MNSREPTKSLGFLIVELARLMRRDFNARVSELGLTQAQWRALAHLSRMEGCKQVSLADHLEVKPITLTRLVDKLVESGWVERLPDPHDRRAMRLHLTNKARPLIRVMEAKALETRGKAVQGIREEEYRILFNSLKKMKENLMK